MSRKSKGRKAPQTSNLYKSEEGWIRFRERTNSGANARRAKMEHRPKTMIGQRKRVDLKPKFEPGDAPEFVVRKGRKQRRVRIAS